MWRWRLCLLARRGRLALRRNIMPKAARFG
jgi:hypothetical protein